MEQFSLADPGGSYGYPPPPTFMYILGAPYQTAGTVQ